MMLLPSCSQCFFRVGNKAGTKQKKPTLSALSSQAWWQGVLLTLSVLPCPLVEQRGIQHKAVTSPVAWPRGHSPSWPLCSFHRTWGSRASAGGSRDRGLRSFPLLLQWWNFYKRCHNCSFKSCFSLYFVNSCCSVAYFWGVCEGQRREADYAAENLAYSLKNKKVCMPISNCTNWKRCSNAAGPFH